MLSVANNAKSELEAAINSSSTTISLPTGAGSKFPTGNFVVTVWSSAYASPGDDANREIILISTRTDDTLTIGARAQESTAQSDHSIADHIACLFTAGTWDELVAYVDTNVTTEAATGAEIDTGTEANKHVTPAAIADSYLLLTTLLGSIYPVGCIYTTTVSTNPATVFGFGTWEAFGSGKALVGVDTGDTDFDTVEETGGNKTITISTTTMPSHTHSVDPAAVNTSSSGLTLTVGSNEVIEYTGSGYHLTVVRPDGYSSDGDVNLGGGTGSHFHSADVASTTSGGAGSGSAHSNVQPYITVYFFKRTA